MTIWVKIPFLRQRLKPRFWGGGVSGVGRDARSPIWKIKKKILVEVFFTEILLI